MKNKIIIYSIAILVGVIFPCLALEYYIRYHLEPNNSVQVKG